MNCALLWNTYRNDIEWFKISARSFSKFARGWDTARCIVPNTDLELFRPVCAEHRIELQGGDEWPGKGFNWHQHMTCHADEFLPGAEVIFHIDGDTVFAQECSPADWLPGGKILQPFTEYRHFLQGPVALDAERTFMGFTGKVFDMNRNQYMWKFAVDYALGWPAERECMPWMPMINHRDVYAKTRAIIAARFPDQGFDGYVHDCRNEWPQSFAEFNTLGAVAHKFFTDRYEWYDLYNRPYPFLGKIIQSWSHGGMEREHDYGLQVPKPEINSPRKLFQHLGLV